MGMTQISISDIRMAHDAARLEELVRDSASESDTPTALMHEHLDAARFYLLGGMSHEYGLSLNLAQELLPEIENQNLRGRIADFLRTRQSADFTTVPG
jgi:hypothetical protein